ncbi:hypothetical protein BN1318_390020 [Staphylococcus capitis]|nr:hypothetical protein BN1318_390020 [Staphylococcus capitis]
MQSINLYDLFNVALEQMEQGRNLKDIEISIESGETHKNYEAEYIDFSEIHEGLLTI